MGLAGAAAGALAGPVLQAGAYATLVSAAGLLMAPVLVLLARPTLARDPRVTV